MLSLPAPGYSGNQFPLHHAVTVLLMSTRLQSSALPESTTCPGLLLLLENTDRIVSAKSGTPSANVCILADGSRIILSIILKIYEKQPEHPCNTMAVLGDIP